MNLDTSIGPANSASWYAVHSACNHERSVVRQLQAKNICCLLPTYKTISRWSDRTKEVERPLFPGYLFVQIELNSRLQVLNIPSVVRLVGTSKGPVEIPFVEIDNLQRAMERNGEIAPHDFLSLGDTVRVVQGPFAGMYGILSRRENQLRVIVSLGSIQRAFCVNVSVRDLESAKGHYAN